MLTYVGHATVLIDMDGTRILTDPVLRYQFRALRRHAPDLDLGILPSLDAVVVSHFHLDHLNPASLWLIPPETPLLVPEGGRDLLRRYHFRHVTEMAPGRSVTVGALEVTATHAEHDGRRYPWGTPMGALGYLVTGSRQVYFAGDTSLFQGMQTISEHVDVALLPVWGWGRMKEDHLSPHDAARALALLRPQVLASGNTGLISFAGAPHRVTLEEMDRDYPGLIDGMTGHPGVGFVMVATEDAGPVVIGARGRHYLDDGRVQGEDPLAVYGPAPGRHLLRTHGFSTGRVGGRGGQLDITPRPDHPSEGVV